MAAVRRPARRALWALVATLVVAGAAGVAVVRAHHAKASIACRSFAPMVRAMFPVEVPFEPGAGAGSGLTCLWQENPETPVLAAYTVTAYAPALFPTVRPVFAAGITETLHGYRLSPFRAGPARGVSAVEGGDQQVEFISGDATVYVEVDNGRAGGALRIARRLAHLDLVTPASEFPPPA